MIGGKKHKKLGFSLVELLVAMFLFVITITILTRTYVRFMGTLERMSNESLLQQDTRYVFEYLAREVRNNKIDYSKSLEYTKLNLLSTEGDEHIIKLSDSGDPDCGTINFEGFRCLLLSVDGGSNWSPLTSENVDVRDFSVFVQPVNDPFELNVATNQYQNNQQPLVTIHLTLRYMSNVENERADLDSQFTVSSKVYER